MLRRSNHHSTKGEAFDITWRGPTVLLSAKFPRSSILEVQRPVTSPPRHGSVTNCRQDISRPEDASRNRRDTVATQKTVSPDD